MEKTFEEITDDLYHYECSGIYEEFVSKNQVISLLKQVREATIAECEIICRQGTFSFKRLPTDRIKTKQ